MIKLPKDSREFVALLNSHHVKYLVIGGYAVAWHGHPRFTGDVDFLVESSPENARALVSVLDSFGFGFLKLTETDFQKPATVFQFGRPPHRIDLLTTADGIEFAEAWASRESVVWDDLPVNVISKALLLKNKLATGRAQDLADARWLQA